MLKRVLRCYDNKAMSFKQSCRYFFFVLGLLLGLFAFEYLFLSDLIAFRVSYLIFRILLYLALIFIINPLLVWLFIFIYREYTNAAAER